MYRPFARLDRRTAELFHPFSVHDVFPRSVRRGVSIYLKPRDRAACLISKEDTLLAGDDEPGLVREAQSGNERAFRRVLERHYPLIYSVVHGIARGRAETEDTVQEVFIKIFRALPDFRGDSRLSTWIYRIARNEAINAVGKRRPPSVPLDDCDHLADDRDGPETSRAKRIEHERLERLMDRLDEKQRIALELRYAGEKSYEEIAQIMDIPLGTVKTTIHRAKRSLRRMITAGGARTSTKGSGES
jgi:RNA polymerase sigma-70 factor (ECF subfamily)